MSATIETRPAEHDRPKIEYRAAGDRHLLIEYGEIDFDLALNFFVTAAAASLERYGVPGLVDAAPGFRSLLIRYDPAVIRQPELVRRLDEVHDALDSVRELVIPSREVVLPIAFDDSASREAVRRYATTIRADAPNVRQDSNIDYIVDYNGLPDRRSLYDTVLATSWWNAYTGFYPGLPFMYPLDARRAISVPKYNPTRTWTAEGAVGIGGPCVAIYPVESPGGYQLFGRTVPVYDIFARHDAFNGDPILIRPGDRVRFVEVPEEQLLEARRDVLDNRYDYSIEDSPFLVADYVEFAAEVAAEAGALQAVRERAAAETEVP